MNNNNGSTEVKIKFLDSNATLIMPMILLLVDYLAIGLAEQTAFMLRQAFLGASSSFRISWLNYHVVFPACLMLFLNFKGLYNSRIQFWKVMAGVFQSTVYGLTSIILLLYVAHISGYTSRFFVGTFGVFAFLFIVTLRFITKKLLERLKLFQVPLLILGAGKTAAILLPHIENDTGLGYKIIGYLEDGKPDENIADNYKCLGGFKDAEKVIQETGVQRVMVIAPGLSNSKIQSIVYRLQPLVNSIGFIPDMGTMPLSTLDMTNLVDGHIVMFKLHNNLAQWYNRAFKYTFDFILTMIGTLAISPLLLFIAVWIYKDSPGPVIFKHIRVGKDGKPFPCYKFRSMCVDSKERLEQLLATDPEAKAEWERDFKLKNDPRVTKSGAFLRKTSLDELPQIFNVLKGEMSLVGPRPIISDEIPRYGEYINDYYMVRPGITGMWQTSGRSDIDYDERVQMDTWYVRNWSVWFDIVLLYRTFSVVVHKKGAY